MTRRTRWLAVLGAALIAAPQLAAQYSHLDSIVTPNGVCRKWASIPGGSSPVDSSYARCALDRAPRLLSDPALPQPIVARGLGGEFTVIVNADGSVDGGLTRAWTLRGDLAYDSIAYRRTLEAINAWRFRPGMRNGKAVRSGFIMYVDTDNRIDTLPQRLEWSYVEHTSGDDSLRGRWETLAVPRASLTDQQRDSLEKALVRRLYEMRVLRSSLGPYCTVLDREDSACARKPEKLRLFISRAHLTEDGRVVVYPTGDYLADWPPGFHSATYPGWSGRCVGIVRGDTRVSVDCDIEPRYVEGMLQSPWTTPTPPKWYVRGDSIRLTVVATTHGAFQTDTMRTVVHQLPRLSERAVIAPRTSCGYTWNAYTTQDSGAVTVIHGDISERGTLFVTQAKHAQAPRPKPGSCAAKKPGDSSVTAFMLGDVGDSVRTGATLCMGDPMCSVRYELDARKHTLVDRAHVRFRLADLRRETRAGEQVALRVFVDPVPEGLVPLLVVRRGAKLSASLWALRRVALDAWEFNVNYSPTLPQESEFAVYLVAR